MSCVTEIQTVATLQKLCTLGTELWLWKSIFLTQNISVGCHGMKWTQWWKCENTWMSLRKKIIILVEGNLRWLLDTTLRHWVTMLKRNRQPEQSYTDMQQEVMWCLNTLKVSNFKQFEPVIFITEDSLFLSTSHSKTVACVLTKSLFPIWQRRRRRRGKKQPCD